MILVGCSNTRPIIAPLPLAVHHALPRIDASEYQPVGDDGEYFMIHKSTIRKLFKRDALLRVENDINRRTLMKTHGAH